ncbi:hypothetical protein N7456_001296 [Penicillium angulare]|uniref:Endonuclease/exonuclease/phosphatase domain-containing protein n=1 Tax=Penicillium angulare TaxID=116970 RepID=A0A9W9GF48_9EURO|nr:hypothetical protein N7456_001296 [Penicillium angulare]
MDFTRAQLGFLSWKHEVPFPYAAHAPQFQSWHTFDSTQTWIPIFLPTNPDSHTNNLAEPNETASISRLALLTWNIDGASPRTEERVTDIITHITDLQEVDIIFFQEVSKPALQQILKDDRIRKSWLSSECDNMELGNRPFTTMTLLSKARFTNSQGEANTTLGPIWRVSFPSHFGRDALCCDIFVSPSEEPLSPSTTSTPATRVRLMNVHLDSLPIKPSHRPQQISIASSFLHIAGKGLVAGDFNPVLDEDADLLERNNLTDVWSYLRPGDSGFTWGLDGEQPFPPNRLDKVATLELRSHNIETLEPKRLSGASEPSEDGPLWSDHHGLLYSFSLPNEEKSRTPPASMKEPIGGA